MNRKHQLTFDITEKTTVIKNAFNTAYYIRNDQTGMIEEKKTGSMFLVNITEEGKYTLEDNHHRTGFWYVQYFEEKNGKIFMTVFDEKKYKTVGGGKS
jgi:hypothetical protein